LGIWWITQPGSTFLECFPMNKFFVPTSRTYQPSYAISVQMLSRFISVNILLYQEVQIAKYLMWCTLLGFWQYSAFGGIWKHSTAVLNIPFICFCEYLSWSWITWSFTVLHFCRLRRKCGWLMRKSVVSWSTWMRGVLKLTKLTQLKL